MQGCDAYCSSALEKVTRPICLEKSGCNQFVDGKFGRLQESLKAFGTKDNMVYATF